MRKDGWIDVDWTRDRKSSKHPSMLEVEGIAVTRQVPLPFEANTANEEAGVLGRILKEVPIPIIRFREMLLEVLEMAPQFDRARNLEIDWGLDLWGMWIVRQPLKERTVLIKALERVRTYGLQIQDLVKRAFLKIEKTLGTVTA